MEHGLVDEFHRLVTPVAVTKGQPLFEDAQEPPSRLSSTTVRPLRCLPQFPSDMAAMYSSTVAYLANLGDLGAPGGCDLHDHHYTCDCEALNPQSGWNAR